MLSQKQIDAACAMFGEKFCTEALNTPAGADWLAHSVQQNRGKGDQTIQPKPDSVEELFFDSAAKTVEPESKYASKFFGCLETETPGQKSHLKPDDFFGWQNHETKEKSGIDPVKEFFLK